MRHQHGVSFSPGALVLLFGVWLWSIHSLCQGQLVPSQYAECIQEIPGCREMWSSLRDRFRLSNDFDSDMLVMECDVRLMELELTLSQAPLCANVYGNWSTTMRVALFLVDGAATEFHAQATVPPAPPSFLARDIPFLAPVTTMICMDAIVPSLLANITTVAWTNVTDVVLDVRMHDSLPATTFQNMPNLQTLRLVPPSLHTQYRTPLRSLPPNLFESNPFLRALDIRWTSLPSFPRLFFSATRHVDSLILNNNLLADVPSDLDVLHNLRELLLVRNNIALVRSRDLALLGNLEHLELSHNALENIATGAFDDLTSLKLLVLSDNVRLTSLPDGLFSSLSSLERVHMDGLGLTSISLTTFLGLSRLDSISLARNSLTAIPTRLFSAVPQVRRVDLSNNNLFSLPSTLLWPLVNLTSLHVAENSITALATGVFHPLTELQYVDLSFNVITFLPPGLLQGLSKLEFFHCFGNAITSLPPTLLDPATSLMSVDFSINPLREVPATLFSRNAQLTSIGLKQCGLTSLPATLLHNSPDVEELYLGFNQLETLPANFFLHSAKVKHLELQFNLMSELDTTLLPLGISTLDIGSNLFSHVPDISPLTALLQLSLNNNNISLWDPSALPQFPLFRRLNMSSNPITAFPNPLPFPNMQFVACDNCKLTSLPADLHYPNLLEAWFTHNHLTSIPKTTFSNNPMLVRLSLDNNAITRLDSGALDGLPSLLILSLQNNKLTHLDDDVFASHSHLHELNLNHNDLTALPRSLANCTELSLLSLNNNNLIEPVPLSFIAGMADLVLLRLANIPLKLDLRVDGSTPLPRLTVLELGWPEMDGNNFPPGILCSMLVQTENLLTLRHTAYQSLDLTCGLNWEFSTVDVSNNTALRYFGIDSDSHFINVSMCHSLNTIQLRDTEILDISYTNLSMSSAYCRRWGMQHFIAHSLPAHWSLDDVEKLFSICVGSVVSIDLSFTPWLVSLLPFRSITRVFNWIHSPLAPLVSDPDTFVEIPRSLELTNILLRNVPIECTTQSLFRIVRGVPSLLHIANMVLYEQRCACSFGFEVVDDECVLSTAWIASAGSITLVTFLALLGGVGITVGVRYVYARQKRFKSTIDLQQHLLADAEEEVFALKKVWEISDSELMFLDRIDKTSVGAFGEVWLAEWGEMKVAVKVLKTSMMMMDESTVMEFEKEVEFLQRTRHRNVVRFFGAGRKGDTEAPFLVLEYMARGPLSAVLRDSWESCVSAVAPLGAEALQYRMALDIAEGMTFIHSLGHIHRDLKSGNVLVTSTIRCKISDFGTIRQTLSQRKQRGTSSGADGVGWTGVGDAAGDETKFGQAAMAGLTSNVGTPMYMSPEVLDGQAYSASCDVWSYGIILWELWSEQPPDLIQQVRGSEKQVVDACGMLSQLLRDGHRLSFDVKSSSSEALGIWFQELAQQCVDEDPKSRPSFNTVFSIFDAKMNQLTFRNLRLSTSAGNFGKN
eukprot:m.275556 g.275556  ORF g.275556 m.275556 type:complete len:1468 (+) comp15697_c1_seq7:91-4494(+)